MGIPGQQYFAGTHLNPNVTWWSRSAPFFAYINRCQAMLQRGVPVADVLYYYGDHVPNFAQLRASDPAKLGAGYDYDVITEDAVLNRLSARDGKLVLPGDVEYRLLVLPDHAAMSLPVARKLRELVSAGAAVAGPKPRSATGLAGFPARDRELAQIADALWQPADGDILTSPGGTTSASSTARAEAGPPKMRSAPRHVISGSSPSDILRDRRLAPDFEFAGGDEKTEVSFIHRRDGAAELYFVTSRGKRAESLRCTFRVSGKAPELWDPVSGERRFAAAYEEKDGRTTLPLEFNPCGSVFVVFREASARHGATAASNAPSFAARQEVSGPWQVAFDPRWGGPASATFDRLVSWPTREEAGIKFYSGAATYRASFDLAERDATRKSRLFVDLGMLRELAEVRLNGKPLGIAWAPPFRVEITKAVRATGNVLEIDVVNFWPNRIIGDASLPADQRLTKTNIRKLTAQTPLEEAGLFGPVQLLQRESAR
jgi:hypothetical protein